MANKIKTFEGKEFMDEFMQPAPKLRQIVKEDYGRFFIVRVQDLIKLSRLPVPPNRVTTHTIIFLTSGFSSMKIGFQNVEIHKNECLVVPAGQVFSYDKHEVNEGFLCSFDPDFLVGKIGSSELLKEFEFLNIWGNPTIKPDLSTAGYLAQSFQRVLDEYAAYGLKNPTIIQSYMIAALCDLQSTYKPLFNSKSKAAVKLTNRFKELLPKHIKQTHKVADWASMLHVSPNHLNKTIREITGKSTSKWIDETLITEAKVLLFQSNLSISEIAADLGLFDPSYFSRFFKKYEGISPQEYRKMI